MEDKRLQFQQLFAVFVALFAILHVFKQVLLKTCHAPVNGWSNKPNGFYFSRRLHAQNVQNNDNSTIITTAMKTISDTKRIMYCACNLNDQH